MKKIFGIVMAAAVALGMTGCSNESPAKAFTSEELGNILTTARSEHSEMEISIVTDAEAEGAQMILELSGLSAEDMDAFAISISPMNVHAYGIAIVKPAADKAEAVKTALDEYIAMQQRNFEFYLPDQKLIADAAICETLDSGYVVLVMSENSTEIFESIKTALAA